MVYDFKCPSCQFEQEVQCSVEEGSKEFLCAVCGTEMYKRINSVPFHLKGHGWAKDGYSSIVGNIVKSNGTLKTDEDGGRIE